MLEKRERERGASTSDANKRKEEVLKKEIKGLVS